MSELIGLMLAPFVAALVIAGLHTYMGLHVISRMVIFVDLALAQMAALGATMAFLVGHEPGTTVGYLYSLGFTVFGAALFAVTRLRDQRIPQEAIIGIVFAVSSALAIIVADRAPRGAEHVAEMLTGALLWVTWPTIWKMALVYLAIGLFHYVFRRQFLRISLDPEQAEAEGLNLHLWDFLFYLSFGLMITFSVQVAGLLLVFSFLIVPAAIGMLLATRLGPRLAIGWIVAPLVSLVGLYFSYTEDFPSGPSVVASFGAFLVVAGVIRYVARAEAKLPAVARVGAVGAALVVVLWGSMALSGRGGEEEVEVGSAVLLTTPEEVTKALAALPEDQRIWPELLAHQSEIEEMVRAGSVELSGGMLEALVAHGEEAGSFLRAGLEGTESPWLQLRLAEGLARLGDPRGLPVFISLLEGDRPLLLKLEAHALLHQFTDRAFGYDPQALPSEQEVAVVKWRAWWEATRDRLVWDAQTGRFSTP